MRNVILYYSVLVLYGALITSHNRRVFASTFSFELYNMFCFRWILDIAANHVIVESLIYKKKGRQQCWDEP